MGSDLPTGQLVWAGIMFLCGLVGLFVQQADVPAEDKNPVPKVWVILAFILGVALLFPVVWDAITRWTVSQLPF